MIYDGPCLFRERIHLHSSLYDIDSLGSTSEGFEASIGKQLFFDGVEGFVGKCGTKDVISEALWEARRMRRQTLSSLVYR